MAGKIYVTGFGAFPGIDENPSAAVAQSFGDRAPDNCTVVSRVLPVSFAQSPQQTREDIAANSPTAIIHFGVHGQTTELLIETSATNYIDPDREDADGEKLADGRINRDQEPSHRLRTSLQAERVRHVLGSSGFPTRISTDCGSYLCNFIYYKTLSDQAASGSALPTLFVHVPQLGVVHETEDSTYTWNKENLIEACHILIAEVASHFDE